MRLLCEHKENVLFHIKFTPNVTATSLLRMEDEVGETAKWTKHFRLTFIYFFAKRGGLGRRSCLYTLLGDWMSQLVL